MSSGVLTQLTIAQRKHTAYCKAKLQPSLETVLTGKFPTVFSIPLCITFVLFEFSSEDSLQSFFLVNKVFQGFFERVILVLVGAVLLVDSDGGKNQAMTQLQVCCPLYTNMIKSEWFTQQPSLFLLSMFTLLWDLFGN